MSEKLLASIRHSPELNLIKIVDIFELRVPTKSRGITNCKDLLTYFNQYVARLTNAYCRSCSLYALKMQERDEHE